MSNHENNDSDHNSSFDRNEFQLSLNFEADQLIGLFSPDHRVHDISFSTTTSDTDSLNTTHTIKNTAPSIMATARLQKFVQHDTDIPQLPTFPFAQQQLDKELSATVTYKQNNIQKLIYLYDTFNNIRNQILSTEASNPSTTNSPRNTTVTSLITDLRSQLSDCWYKVHDLTEKIHGIVKLQESLKPNLELPTDYLGHDDETATLDITEVKGFVGNSAKTKETTGTDLKKVWEKLLFYAEQKKLSHANFRLALTACVQGEPFEYILENNKQTLKSLASMLASRFITENTHADAVHKLETFTRNQGEPIRQTLTRLRYYIDKAILIYHPSQQGPIRDYILIKKIKDMISPSAKTLIERTEAEYLTQGMRTSLDTILRIAETEERRTGQPVHDMTIPVSLYHINNTNDTQSATTSKLEEKLETLTNMVQQMALTQPSIRQDDPLELNMSLKNVSFRDRDRSKKTTPERPATPFSFTDPSGKLPTTGTTPKPTNYTSNRDRSQDRQRFPSYDRYVTDRSYRDRSRERSREARDNNRQKSYSQNRNLSPATYYKIKSDALKHNADKSPQPYVPPKQPTAPTYPTREQTQLTDSLRQSLKDQFFQSKQNQQQHHREFDRSQSRPNSRPNSRPQSRNSSQTRNYHKGYNNGTRKYYPHNAVINAQPSSNVHVYPNCQLCQSPIQHNMAQCYVVKQIIDEIKPEN